TVLNAVVHVPAGDVDKPDSYPWLVDITFSCGLDALSQFGERVGANEQAADQGHRAGARHPQAAARSWPALQGRVADPRHEASLDRHRLHASEGRGVRGRLLLALLP